jgi:hypothetical protein
LANLIEKNVLMLAEFAKSDGNDLVEKLVLPLTVVRQTGMCPKSWRCNVKQKRLGHVINFVKDVRQHETQSWVSRLEQVACESVFQKVSSWKRTDIDWARLPAELIQEALLLAFVLQSTAESEWSVEILEQWQSWWSCCPPLDSLVKKKCESRAVDGDERGVGLADPAAAAAAKAHQAASTGGRGRGAESCSF